MSVPSEGNVPFVIEMLAASSKFCFFFPEVSGLPKLGIVDVVHVGA